jgi:dipeptidyl aminopeptidase/acylaminoacyl peptidase
VTDIALSPDGSRLAFAVQHADRAGAPYTRLWTADVGAKTAAPLASGVEGSSPRWSPDGKRLAFVGRTGEGKSGIVLISADGSGATPLADIVSSNHPLPQVGERLAWSPDGRRIAFVSAVAGPEPEMEADPIVISRYWFRPASSAGARFSDNRRLKLFVVDVRHHRLPASGGTAQLIVPEASTRGSLSSFVVAKDGSIASAFSTPAAPAELHWHGQSGSTALTTLNKELLGSKTLAEVEAITFKSGGLEVEAFLTKPARMDPKTRHPMIVMIHGGPHSQQGPAFNHRAQAYAGRGWAALMVNYRGSTGYGQAYSNAIARDQNGGEARDVLAGVDAALARHAWIDPNALGVEGQSYGGQLSNWLVTQTPRFAAAVPAASISNLVSHNYMSVYHDYLEQEYGGRPHTGGIIDMLWERSAIRYANRVKTPVMFIHGDNDQLVNPAEIEQFYIALKDVGVETVMVRYPREGHGMRESKHIADTIERSIAWYERHFAARRNQVTY